MNLTNKWQEDDGQRLRTYFGEKSSNRFYKRRVFKIWYNFSLLESIRLIILDNGGTIVIHYDRMVGMTEDKMFRTDIAGRFYEFLYKFYNKIFGKEFVESVKDIRDSELYNKYPFIGDGFKNVVRDRRLKEIGIE